MLAFPSGIMYNTAARVKKPVTLQLTHPEIPRFVPV